MKVIDETILDRFRHQLHCEYCGRKLRGRAEPHHLICRGRNSAFRMDVPLNLIALGGPADCNCHGKAGTGQLTRSALLEIVAAREGRLSGEEVWIELSRMKWRETP